MSARPSGAVVLAAVLAAICGCAPQEGGGDAGGGASAGASASPSASGPPVWEHFGGVPLPSPSASPSADEGSPGEASADDAPSPSPAEPADVPRTCADAGIDGDESAFIDLIGGEPDFTGVRSENVLECSWAGYSQDDGSAVVLVTFAPNGSLVEVPGEVPDAAEGDPAFFSTPAVAELGGVAQWQPSEPFSRVRLHLPGLLVTVSANSDRLAEAGPGPLAAAVDSADLVLGDDGPAGQDGGDQDSEGEPAPAED